MTFFGHEVEKEKILWVEIRSAPLDMGEALYALLVFSFVPVTLMVLRFFDVPLEWAGSLGTLITVIVLLSGFITGIGILYHGDCFMIVLCSSANDARISRPLLRRYELREKLIELGLLELVSVCDLKVLR